VCAVSYLALLFGFWTPLAHVASWLSVLSLHGRVLFIGNGGDVVLGELCLWTMFLPTGRRYSIDALRARSGSDAELADATPVVSLAVTALLLQLAFIYLLNALHKTGATWRDGTAVHYVLYQSRIVTAFGVWAREHLSFAVLHALTLIAHVLEWVIAVLLLVPFGRPLTRRGAIAGMWALHVGFALFLNLSMFVPAMLAFTPNLLSPEDWDALAGWRAKLAKSKLAAVDSLRAACEWLSRYSPVAGSPAKRRKIPEVLAALCMLVAGNELLAENPAARRFVRVGAPRPTQAAVSYLQLFEAWTMFAPDAPTTEMNVFVDAVTADGRHVDPVSQEASPRYPAPGPHIPDRLDQDAFFCDYLPRIRQRADYHPAFTDWILRYPERTGRPSDRIVSYEAFVVEQDSPPPGETNARNVRTTSFIKWPRR
jgi:vitamin K-dependent gamma-carboxylase-like protein